MYTTIRTTRIFVIARNILTGICIGKEIEWHCAIKHINPILAALLILIWRAKRQVMHITKYLPTFDSVAISVTKIQWLSQIYNRVKRSKPPTSKKCSLLTKTSFIFADRYYPLLAVVSVRCNFLEWLLFLYKWARATEILPSVIFIYTGFVVTAKYEID